MKTLTLSLLAPKYRWLVLFWTVSLWIPCSGRAERELPVAEQSLKERFLREAPAAWQEYARIALGNQGSVRTKQTRSNRNYTYEFHTDYKANEGCALVSTTRREKIATDDDYREEVYGINPRYAFQLSRRSAGDNWTVALIVDLQKEQLPDDPFFSFGQKRTGFGVPVYLEGESLESIVKQASFVVQRCRPVTLGNEHLVEIRFTLSHDPKESANKRVVDEGVLVLDPARYWCLRRFEGRARAGQALGKIRLERHTASIPCLSTIHRTPGLQRSCDSTDVRRTVA